MFGYFIMAFVDVVGIAFKWKWISPILGIVTDAFGGRQTAAFVALLIIWLYTLCILKPVREISEK